LGATNIEVSIFNRWGERVYYNPAQLNGITGTSGWDGTKSNKPAPVDTYVYQMKITYFDTVSKDISGTVTLMK
jgi:gliding motility-associated-like protein